MLQLPVGCLHCKHSIPSYDGSQTFDVQVRYLHMYAREPNLGQANAESEERLSRLECFQPGTFECLDETATIGQCNRYYKVTTKFHINARNRRMSKVWPRW